MHYNMSAAKDIKSAFLCIFTDVSLKAPAPCWKFQFHTYDGINLSGISKICRFFLYFCGVFDTCRLGKEAVMALSRRAFIGASLSAAAMVAAPSALAQQPQSQPISFRNSPQQTAAFDAAKQAQSYASNSGGIGVVVNFGPFDGAKPPEAVGQYFKDLIQGKGERAEFFVGRTSAPGYSLVFAYPVPGTGTDFMSPNVAYSKIDEIIAEKRRFDDHLSLSSGPN